MNTRQRIIVGFGVAAGLVGLILTLFPSFSPDISVFSVIIAAIALVAFAATFFVINAIFRESQPSVALPHPEGRSQAVPGDEIDCQISSISAINRQQLDLPEDYKTLYARLETAALSILSQQSLDEEQTRDVLNDGSWTADSRAADFFGGLGTPKPSTREQLRGLRTGEAPVKFRARHAIAALARRLQNNSREATRFSRNDQQEETEKSIPVQPLSAREENKEGEYSSGQLQFPDSEESIVRRTDRWQGASALALVVGAAGMLLRRPTVLLTSVIGVGLAAYAQAATPPPADLETERTVSDAHPSIGSDVQVTVTVRNVGETLLPNCTLVDGVPSGLVVTNGSPRHGTALRPGKTTTFSYTLSAARGEHTFDPVAVIARDFSGSVERLTRVQTSTETTITCVPQLEPLEAIQLRHHAKRFGGRLKTDTVGSGVEFSAIREYQPGDPRSRINWNQLAKRGELSTLQFREERTATVVLVVDARNEAYLAPEPNERSAVDRSVESAGRVFATLLTENIDVGLSALSSGSQTCWLAPGSGNAHQEQARQMLATHPALTGTRSMRSDSDDGDSNSWKHLRGRLPADAQVFIHTPLCDDDIMNIIEQLEVLGHAPTVISPDPTGLNSPGQQLAHIERTLRITKLRSSGIPVTDWMDKGDDSLLRAITRLGIHEDSVARTHGKATERTV